MSLYNSVILSILTFAVISCGGGSTPDVKDQNKNPYKIIDLGVGNAADINENGYVVGSSDGNAYLYDGVTKKNIGTFGTGIVSPVAINNNNDIVALYKIPASTIFTDVAFYNNSGWTLLGRFGGEFAYASDINDSGQISGAYKPSGSGYRAYIYTSTSFIEIPVPGKSPSESAYNDAMEISESGMVTGTYKDIYDMYRTYLFDGTDVITIPALTGLRTRPSHGYGLNEAGFVVGDADDLTYSHHASIYSDNVIKQIGDDTLTGRALDINNKNVVVGLLYDDVGDSHAFIYDGVDLNYLSDLIDNKDWTLRTAKRINDKGMIVGQGLINNETHGYLLIPQ